MYFRRLSPASAHTYHKKTQPISASNPATNASATIHQGNFSFQPINNNASNTAVGNAPYRQIMISFSCTVHSLTCGHLRAHFSHYPRLHDVPSRFSLSHIRQPEKRTCTCRRLTRKQLLILLAATCRHAQHLGQKRRFVASARRRIFHCARQQVRPIGLQH